MNHQIGELRNFFHGVTHRIQKIEEKLSKTDDKVDQALYGLEVIRDKQFQTDSLILDKSLKTLDESELRTIRLLFGAGPASINQIVPPQEVMSDDLLGELSTILENSEDGGPVSSTKEASDTSDPSDTSDTSDGKANESSGTSGKESMTSGSSESDSAIKIASSK
jgi:hypothetical protein